MAMPYKWNIALVPLLALLIVNVCVGAHLHRREIEPTKPSETDQPSATTTLVKDNVPSVRPVINPNDHERECVRFEHSFCNNHVHFGYEYALFPNHKGQTPEEATKEFSDFTPLISSGCSNKVDVFLCFTYFPFCMPPTDDTHAKQGDRLEEILPCKETCEEVHNSECTEHVLNATKGKGWADHLNCNQDIFKSKDTQQCATGEPTVNDRGGKELIDDDCEDDECQSRCNIRTKCSGSTFKNSKNKYRFAAKVSVIRKLENNHINCNKKHAYSIHVEKQFNLLSHDPNTDELTEAPLMQNQSIIHTSPANCEECPVLTNGTTYLIAGQYHIREDGTTVWELPNGKSLSMASKWEGEKGDDYDDKLQGWIDDANDARQV